jgi:hypothetical protein
MTAAVNWTFIWWGKESIWLTLCSILLRWSWSSVAGWENVIIFLLIWRKKLLGYCFLLLDTFLILLWWWHISAVLVLVISLLHCHILSCLQTCSLCHFFLSAFGVLSLFAHHSFLRRFIWIILLLRLLSLSWHLLIVNFGSLLKCLPLLPDEVCHLLLYKAHLKNFCDWWSIIRIFF